MLLGPLLTFGIAALVTPLLIAALRQRAILDKPNLRSAHVVPTPRGGGAAIVVGCAGGLCGAAILGVSLPLALAAIAGLFAAIGLAEDISGVPAKARLALQAMAAVLIVPWLVASVDGPTWWALAVGAGSAFGLVAYVNAFNFMDGINGISAAQAIIAGATFAAVGAVEGLPALQLGGLLIAAASLGWAPFNFPHARVFLGDVGSYFIGAWLAGCALLALASSVPPEAVLAPLALYLADTGTTLVKRVARGAVWHESHADHTFQRLYRRGWSHARTTGVVAACLAIMSGLGLLTLDGGLIVRVVADLAIFAIAVVYLVAPRFLDRPVRALQRVLP